MISKQDILAASVAGRDRLLNDGSYRRELLPRLASAPKGMALVVAGIRRCGKSTLMGQLMGRTIAAGGSTFYFNFDTPAAYGFAFDDFRIIDELLAEARYDALYFDEIQEVDGWEVYVRAKLDEGYEVVVTGSNASMLSRELGTRLTGRHLACELFPFSYGEYCGYRRRQVGEASLIDYLDAGGMPQRLVSGNAELLGQMVNDIIYRDIAVRFNISDDRTLRLMFALLVGNVGCLVQPSKFKQQLGVKSATTVSNYMSHFEQAYLLAFVPRFAYSVRAQLMSPKKVYCIDNGVVATVSSSFSRNVGHKLENALYCHLRRHHGEIYYYSDGSHECDFLVARNSTVHTALQACFQLTADNRRREVDGLLAAMEELNLSEGCIVTLGQTDRIVAGKRTITVVPAHRFFADSEGGAE